MLKGENVIYNEDCLKGMKSIPKNSVDFIMTDPPYYLHMAKNLNFKKKGKIQREFDFDQFKSEGDYLHFMQEMIKELYRVCKEGGSGYLFCSENFVSFLTRIIQQEGFKCRKIFYWKKTNCFPSMKSRKMWASSVEMAIHFSKGKLETWKPVNTTMHNLIELPICNGKVRCHPTQKPLKLIQFLTDIHTNKGDVVLDPFMGSGTTAVAAHKLGLKFIGFEKCPVYCNYIRHRFNELGLSNPIQKMAEIPVDRAA